MLIGHLVIHIVQLLNWDENLNPGYSGYNGQAVKWWDEHIGRPLDPNLVYPSLPLDELYGTPVVKKAGGFRAVTNVSQGGFRPMGSS